MDIPIDEIRSSPFQPRLDFDLSDLRPSIEREGIRDPLTVRRVGDHYELMDGERRLRAAKELSLTKVPCVVEEATDEEARRLIWVLNTQRKDYTVQEKANHFRTLRDRYAMGVREIARECGYPEPQIVADHLNVLKLPEDYQQKVWRGEIGIGHIRELSVLLTEAVSYETQVTSLLDQVVEQRLDFMQLRELVKPKLKELKAARLKAAQAAVPELQGVSLETPEAKEKAAKALRREAGRQRKAALTPEEKAKREEDKKRKRAEREAARKKREEAELQKRLEAEKAKMVKLSLQQAEALLLDDPKFLEKAAQKLKAITKGEEAPSESSIHKRKFDVWSIAQVDVDKPYGDPEYPGAIPGDIVGNVLLWFLPKGGKVVDPMAGGGVTEDVCKALGQHYTPLLYDNFSIKDYKYRRSITFNDIAKGTLPPEAQGADLVFADPPYGPLKEYGAPPEGLYQIIQGLAEASLQALNPGGVAAVLMQNYYMEGECMGDLIPLINDTIAIFKDVGFKQIFEATVPLYGKVARSDDHMTHIDRRLLVFRRD